MASFYYNEEHSVTIGEKNTWKDWNLIPTSRPEFSPPLPKTNFLELPGGNGTIDLSDTLTGYTLYQDRTGSWEFVVADQETPWAYVYSEIMNYLQGKRLKAILDDDKYYYYEGRFWIAEHNPNLEATSIVMEYEVLPYKFERTSSIEPWLWDPFDFRCGVIRDFSNLVVNGSLSVSLPGSQMPCSPIITAKGEDLKVTYEKTTYDLPNGVTVIPAMTIMSKEVKLNFTGNGTVSIDYRGGSL